MSIVTITRGPSSGGRSLAEKLAARLGYSCLTNRDVVDACAIKYNIMADELVSKLEEVPGLWQRLTKTHHRYLTYLQASAIEAVRPDNIIYHGLAGQLFLAGIPHVLKIRLETPLDKRVDAVMKEFDKDRDAALKYIQEADERRSRWVRLLYGETWQDPSLYDASFSLHNMSMDTIIEVVCLTLKRDEYVSTEQSRKRLENLSLECEVKAAFASDDDLWKQPITVSALGDVVTLGGSLKTGKLRDHAVEIASQVKGVGRCESAISVLSDPLAGKSHWND